MAVTKNKIFTSSGSKVPPLGGGGGFGGVGGFQILVFKTNLSNTKHISKVKLSLSQHPHIKEWNVDLHDCDKILRVVTENIPAGEVEKIVFNAGYLCEELK